MQTFAVYTTAEKAAPYFDGHSYAVGEHDGARVLLRSIGRVMGAEILLRGVYGAALRADADRHAAEIGGTVVSVDSAGWPDTSAILAAIGGQ